MNKDSLKRLFGRFSSLKYLTTFPLSTGGEIGRMIKRLLEDASEREYRKLKEEQDLENLRLLHELHTYGTWKGKKV